MQILSVALQNFKAHRDRYFEFQPGTNAICGENGAGKTSILEAIAWVLFNYQGDYAKEDLIRNGSSSAQVTVAFTSNYDGRTYEVQRCTQRGYVLFDPQLNERLPYSRIKDEVLPWLRQHLGVSPTTNLAQLFSRTVGVPQGTFTADFLQPTEQRKAVFDAILKVEDYKLAFKQMNALRRYAEDQVAATKQEIQQYEEALAGWEELTQRQQTLAQEIVAQEQRFQTLQQEVATLQTQRDQAKAQAQKIQSLVAQRQGLIHRQQAQRQEVDRLEQSLQQSQAAIALCTAHRTAYEGYQAAEQALASLAQAQAQRQTWQQRLQTLQQQQGQQQADLARCQAQLDGFAVTEQELVALKPQIETQEQLEAQLVQGQRQLEDLRRAEIQCQGYQTQQRQLDPQRQELLQRQSYLQSLQPEVAQIASQEEQRDRLQQQLSRLAAARQFEAELKILVTTSQQRWVSQETDLDAVLQELDQLVESIPLISSDTLDRLRQSIRQTADLHSTLLDALDAILADLADQTDEATLKTTLKALEHDLKQRYGWQAELAQMEALMSQIQGLAETHQTLGQHIAHLSEQLAQRPTVEAHLKTLTQQIEALGYPRQKSQILQRTLHDRPQVEQTHAQLTVQQQAMAQQQSAILAQLEDLATLDQQMADHQAQRLAYQEGYGIYLEHRQMANQHRPLQQALATAQTALAQVNEDLATLEATYQQEAATYDPAQAEALEQRYGLLKTDLDRLAGQLPAQRQRLADLNQQLAGLATQAERRDAAQQRLQAQEKVKRFVVFARKAYNEAGPRITEQYVRSISVQADRLFRELLNRPNVALQWTKDYEIVVQDGPNQRRFGNLSGGEQMCAALAVRLALLKVLADVDIAFFDEPTTNMDRPRRQGLAEAIGRIKSFAQLFVISHDDTFESVTEHVILVERDAT